MPIRPELRKFYRGAAWRETRLRILERAKQLAPERFEWLTEPDVPRCEQCGKPNGQRVETVTVRRVRSWTLYHAMFWRTGGRFTSWIDSHGERNSDVFFLFHRVVRVVLTVAHLNHTAGDDRDENLAALCQWCHLHYDKLHHKETRCERKDAARPLLGVAS